MANPHPTPTPAAIPPVRCPHCRTVDPEIQYGQYTYNTQVYTPDRGAGDDWSTSDYCYEGDVILSASCVSCDGDLTPYLLRRDRRCPGNDTPGGFVHDVPIPRGLPRRTRAICSDAALQVAIDAKRVELGQLLDEQTERARVRR